MTYPANTVGSSLASYANLASAAAGLGDGLIGVLEPWAGAFATTQAEFNSRTFYVWDFLSAAQRLDVSAGTHTLDCAAAINAAITAVSNAGGGTLYFPIGVMLVNSSIIHKSYVKLVGNYSESNTYGVTGAPYGTKILWGGTAPGNTNDGSFVVGDYYQIVTLGTTNWADVGMDGAAAVGSVFKATTASGGGNGVAVQTSVILRCFNVRLSELDGIYMEGQGGASVTGILLDSNNNPSGSQNEFRRFSIRECFIGVQWGTSGLAGSYANDGTRFTTFTIWSSVTGSTGFVLNSGNAGQCSVIESGGIQVMQIGIDIINVSDIQIRRVFGGSYLKTAFIRYANAYNILIEGCDSEGWGSSGSTLISSDSVFLLSVTPDITPIADELWTCIVLTQNQLNNPIVINSPVRIVSTGNQWGQCMQGTVQTAWVTGHFYSVNGLVSTGGKQYICLVAHTSGVFATDLANGDWAINYIPATGMCGVTAQGISRILSLNDGTIPGYKLNDTSPQSGMPSQGWIDGPYCNLTLLDPGLDWIQASVFTASRFTASGSMTWTVTAGQVETLTWTQVGRTMTVAFKINGSTLGGTAGYIIQILIPNGKTAFLDMTVPCFCSNGGTNNILAMASVTAGSNQIGIQPASSALWSLGSVGVAGQITFGIN